MDKSYLNVSDGSGDASLMHIQADRAIAATTIDVDTVSGVPAKFIGTSGDLLATGFIDPATKCDFYGHLDSGNLEIDGFLPGSTDVGNTEGQVVVIKPNTPWADFIADFVQTTPPAGVVNPFAGSSAPAGWLMCDGAAISRTTYADLYAVIGTTFGVGNGSSTFNLPDMRGRNPLGVGARTWTLVAANTDVNTGTDQIAITANKNVYTGKAVVLTTSGTAPTGLTAGNTYYIIVVDSTHIQLASSLANAIAGTAIDITAQGSGNHTLTFTGTNHTLGEAGGEDNHATTISEMPSHTHSKANNYGHGGAGVSDPLIWSQNSTNEGGTVPPTGATGGSAQHNVLNPYLALNHIIKT